MLESSFLDVPGLKVGHFTDPRRPTGCTVILCEGGANAAVSVRGYSTGTRETQLLDPLQSIRQVHALLLTGGSTFGLDACAGVLRYLEERGLGFEISRELRVPIVPAAVIFDLLLGDGRIRPDSQAGYQACCHASLDFLPEGNVGAGAGATVGKIFGNAWAMKGGFGHSSLRCGELVVGAMAVVNAFGDICDPADGRLLAGARSPHHAGFADTWSCFLGDPLGLRPGFGANTTLGCIATNASLEKPALTQVAEMCQSGLPRTIRPVHTLVDGDLVFALSTGALPVAEWAVTAIGILAAEALSRAVLRAVWAADPIPGYPCARDFLAPRR